MMRTERLYGALSDVDLGWHPSVYVMPRTVDGVRALALEALRAGEVGVLDDLELLIVRLLKIVPDDECGPDGKAEPLALFHDETGIVIQWRVGFEGECPACRGTCELTAHGHDGGQYDVECPRCHGTGTADDAEQTFVSTDIDGRVLRKAA